MKKISYKPNLEPTETGKEIAFVIDRTNYIEYQLKEIIKIYVRPAKDKDKFFENILLDNAVINFAGKIKLFLHISKKNKWSDVGKELFVINRIRNAFAHNATTKTHIKVTLKKNHSVENVEHYMTLDTVNSSGQFQQKKRKEALQQFTDNYVVAKKHLDKIIDNMRKRRV